MNYLMMAEGSVGTAEAALRQTGIHSYRYRGRREAMGDKRSMSGALHTAPHEAGGRGPMADSVSCCCDSRPFSCCYCLNMHVGPLVHPPPTIAALHTVSYYLPKRQCCTTRGPNSDPLCSGRILAYPTPMTPSSLTNSFPAARNEIRPATLHHYPKLQGPPLQGGHSLQPRTHPWPATPAAGHSRRISLQLCPRPPLRWLTGQLPCDFIHSWSCPGPRPASCLLQLSSHWLLLCSCPVPAVTSTHAAADGPMPPAYFFFVLPMEASKFMSFCRE